mmetsp:Transcript_13730/g.17038  ORF Transcript_13730/g.17038 Transcript_13730/m.17038 type:complete len:88 (+) Transcript_13730:572-835(+)
MTTNQQYDNGKSMVSVFSLFLTFVLARFSISGAAPITDNGVEIVLTNEIVYSRQVSTLTYIMFFYPKVTTKTYEQTGCGRSGGCLLW